MKKSVCLLFLISLCTLSGVVLGATTHTFKDGDTLWELAARHYGDPTLYPVLLQVNGIDNPRTILNGTVIVIPDKNDMKAIANEQDPERKKALLAKAGAKPGSQGNSNESDKPQTPDSPDKVSRGGEVDPDETSFSNILKGPKVSPDKLIKTNVP